ncbi:hypothetical protein AC249_AIPGENE11606 [Exaiptasia diaphana]|nr:hypothetical protein AC249_AIPGENE11606 [Exaiptasia diaphana]
MLCKAMLICIVIGSMVYVQATRYINDDYVNALLEKYAKRENDMARRYRYGLEFADMNSKRAAPGNGCRACCSAWWCSKVIKPVACHC